MKTLKITEEAYEILATLKWSTRSKTFSEVIQKMDEGLQNFTPLDSILNRKALKDFKNEDNKNQ